MKTIISHFYNEEYLLPWWLNHHKQFFDHGIMIDYDSTDSSVEIIKTICPTWEIVKSKNKSFAAKEADEEVCEYEHTSHGWRIVLNTTEFLVGPIDKVINSINLNQLLIPSISFFDWNPNGELSSDTELWFQKTLGIDYITDLKLRRARSFHNTNIEYPSIGRHFGGYTCTNLLIFHYGHCISSQPMIKRRLQIQHRIPDSDTLSGRGTQHKIQNRLLNEEDLYNFYKIKLPFIKDQQISIYNILNLYK